MREHQEEGQKEVSVGVLWPMEERDRTADQQWVRDRIKAVSERFTAYDALVENGTELDDKDVTVQVQCPLPGHGPDNTPSARYYAADGSGPAHFYCFKLVMRLLNTLTQTRAPPYPASSNSLPNNRV